MSKEERLAKDITHALGGSLKHKQYHPLYDSSSY